MQFGLRYLLSKFSLKKEKISFWTISWIFALNLLSYVALLELSAPYSKIRAFWSLDMHYDGTFPDRRREESR